jgi:hypothetical protein
MHGAKLSVLPRQTAPERELALESFLLTPEEMLEVNSVYRELSRVPAHFFESMAETTSNAGVQYILIDYSGLALFLLDNKNLHPKVALSILDRVGKIEPSTLTELASIRLVTKVMHALIRHPAITSDAQLFKRAWEFSKINLHGIRSKRFDYAGSLLLGALVKQSAIKNYSSEPMSVATLLLILSYINKLDEEQVNSSLRFFSNQLPKEHGPEIDAWIVANMPDCVDLPLSWVLEVVDLYI